MKKILKANTLFILSIIFIVIFISAKWWYAVIFLMVALTALLTKTYYSITSVLGREAAHNGWRYISNYDEEGYCSPILTKGAYKARISCLDGMIHVMEPELLDSFGDFEQLENYLSEIEESEAKSDIKIPSRAEYENSHYLFLKEKLAPVNQNASNNDIKWYLYISLYSAMCYANRNTRYRTDTAEWNSLKRSLIVGMVANRNEKLILDTPQYMEIEHEARVELDSVYFIMAGNKAPSKILARHMMKYFGIEKNDILHKECMIEIDRLLKLASYSMLSLYMDPFTAI